MSLVPVQAGGKIRNEAGQPVNNTIENRVKGNAEICTGKTSVTTNNSRRYQWNVLRKV